MKRLKNSIRILGIGGLFATFLAGPVDAQVRQPWEAFTGCWMSALEGAEDTVLCFRPSGEGVGVSTMVDGEVTGTETLVADGRQRSVEADACTGYQAVDFSADGHRAFLRSELTCEGETRTNSGLMAFVSTNRLLHFREVEVRGEPVSWIEEYRPVARRWFEDRGVEDPSAPNRQDGLVARVRAAQAITIPDVEEAAARLPSGVLQLWVAVQPNDFDLDGEAILRLADEDVPEAVIDVMVAAEFPERFALSIEGGAAAIAEQTENPANASYAALYPVVGYRSYLFDPFFTPFYGFYGYSAFGYRYGAGYLYPPGYLDATRPVRVVVQPQPPSSQGRMINGQGYRRTPPTGGTAMPAPSSRGTISSASAPSQGSSSSNGSTSSEGGSAPARSPSATPTGRTAQPRN